MTEKRDDATPPHQEDPREPGKPQTIGLMPGPVAVNYKHVYVGVASPWCIGEGLEVVLLAKDSAALRDVALKLGLGACDHSKTHEAILGPKSKTTPLSETATPDALDAARYRFLRTRIGHHEAETLSPAKCFYRRWYHDTTYKPDADTHAGMFDAAIDEGIENAAPQASVPGLKTTIDHLSEPLGAQGDGRTGPAESASQCVAAPPIEALAEDFGDPETLLNSRDWLDRALEAKGAKIVGGGIGVGQADTDIELEGCKFNVSIRPIVRAKGIPDPEIYRLDGERKEKL